MIKKYFDNFKGFPKEIWILTLITFINRAGTMVIPFLSKYMKENLEFTYSQIGWVMVFFGMGSIIGTWLSGKLSDKIGFYKVMVFSLFASGIVFILLHYASTFEELCIGILVLTSIADMFRPAMLVCLKTFTAKEDRARAYSLTRAAINLGFLFGPVLGGLIIMQLGYEYIFYVDGLTCILAIIVFVIFVKEKKIPVKSHKQHDKPKEKVSVMKDRPFMLHLAICLITGILFFQIFTTLPLYHKERFNMTEFDSGLLLSLNGLLILLFELPIVNYVSRNKINNNKVISLGLLLMATSFLLLLLPFEAVLVPMMFFMTCGVMLTFPFANSFAMDRSHRQEGKYMAAFTMSYSFAHILSAKTGMEIIQNSGYESNWIFMSVLGVVGTLLVFRLSKMVEKEEVNNAAMVTVEVND